jgi:hypothetical protein
MVGLPLKGETMSKMLRAIEVAGTALWTGASAGFAFVSAPLAFSIVSDRDAFARLTEESLGRLATCANIAGGIAVAAAALQRAPLRGGIGSVALALVTYHEKAIVPAMAQAQAAMGSFNDVAEDDPRRIAYRAMHTRSTRVFGAALLLGVTQLIWAAADR